LSPILVRPVREQLEHDRIIRLLQAKLKRKHDVAVNTGDEQAAPIKVGPGQMYPDLVLTSADKGHRLEGIIEVETGESVNHLEAMAQWAHFGRLKPAFHLYVPASTVDIAKRLLVENQVNVAELWSYHTVGDQTRFTLVERAASRSAEPARTGRSDQAARNARTSRPARKAPASSRAKRPAARASTARKTSAAKQKRK